MVQILPLALLLSAFTPTKGIDPELVAAYERLGGVYGGWVREHGRTQFVKGQKNAEEGLPGFRFDKFPEEKLPTVAMPFGLSFWRCAEDAQLKRLKHLKTLAALDLTQTRVTGAGIKELAALENLSDLDLFWTPISEDGLRELAPLKRLTTLRLTEGVYRTTLSPGAKLTDRAVRVLREIGLLHALRNAEGKNHARPSSAAEVVSLGLGQNQMMDAGLKEMLAAFPNIETLYVTHMSVTDAGLEGLVGLKKLTKLMLNGIEMTDAGMKHVTAVKSLTDLTLSGTELTDAGLRGLTALDRLTSLALGYNELTDAGMKDVAALKGLQRLELCNTKVGDVGVRELTRLEGLTDLNLNWTQVSDKGLKELVGLKRLTKLSLVYAKATESGEADLRRALPGCTIKFARLPR